MSGIDQFSRLVLHMDYDGLLVDATGNNSSLTTTADFPGNIPCVSAGSKFGSACGKFDLSDGSIIIPYNASNVIMDQDFTIDYWMKDTPLGIGYTGFDVLRSAGLMCGIESSGAHFPVFTLGIAAFVGGYYNFLTAQWPLSINNIGWSIEHPFFSYDLLYNPAVWNHFAITGSGDKVNFFINGVSQGEVQLEAAYNNYAVMDWANYPQGKVDTSNLVIGGTAWNESGIYYCAIDELRYSIGIKRWTAGFTPPTEPYSVPDDPKLTKLILSMNGGDESQVFIDSSADPHTVVAYGEVKQDTGWYQLGTASAQFDTSNDYLSIADDLNWEIFNKPFTIHFWFKPVSVTGEQTIFKQYCDPSTYMQCFYNHNTSTIIFEVKIQYKQRIYIKVVATLVLGAFSHIAIVGR